MASQEQFNFFSREGYLVVPELLSPKELDQCKSEIDRLHKLAAVLDSRCELPDSSFQLEPFAPVDHSQAVPILSKIEATGETIKTAKGNNKSATKITKKRMKETHLLNPIMMENKNVRIKMTENKVESAEKNQHDKVVAINRKDVQPTTGPKTQIRGGAVTKLNKQKN